MGRKIRFSFLLLCVCTCVHVRVFVGSGENEIESFKSGKHGSCAAGRMLVGCVLWSEMCILLSPVEANTISSTQATAQRQYGVVQLQTKYCCKCRLPAWSFFGNGQHKRVKRSTDTNELPLKQQQARENSSRYAVQDLHDPKLAVCPTVEQADNCTMLLYSFGKPKVESVIVFCTGTFAVFQTDRELGWTKTGFRHTLISRPWSCLICRWWRCWLLAAIPHHT